MFGLREFKMLFNLKYISSLTKYLIFLTSISIFLIFCDSNGSEYTGPWKEVPTPGGEGQLNACYFTSSDNGWACGWTWNEEEQRSYPLLIHWNGTEWEEYPYGGWFDNEQFIGIIISDISFSSPDDGWCVGNVAISHYENFGFILRYDGSNWYLFKSHFEEAIYDVYCISKNDIWFIVGEINNGDVLYHWDGSDIKRCDTSPNNPGLYDIAFSSSNEGLAVGNYYSVYHWDGTSWTEIDSDPSRPYVNNAVSYYEQNKSFIVGEERMATWINNEYKYYYQWHYFYNDINFSSAYEGWIIGYRPIGGGHGTPTAWNWNGEKWEEIDCPDYMRGNSVFSINENEAWIVGTYRNAYCSSWRYIPQ
jgi:photosystem II stability/assembly factor-like uncharacterized protein